MKKREKITVFFQYRNSSKEKYNETDYKSWSNIYFSQINIKRGSQLLKYIYIYFRFNLYLPHLMMCLLNPFFSKKHIWLSSTQKNLCEGPITEEELQSVINSFEPSKTPGLDGIPTEVYQIFYQLIKDPLLACF